jgi:hypothetical protein
MVNDEIKYWAIKRGHRTGIYADVVTAIANVSICNNANQSELKID